MVGFFGKPLLEDYVDSRIDTRVSSPETLQKAMKSPFMMDYQINQKKRWEEENLNKESSRMKLSSKLISKTGMNKDAMSDTLANMIRIHCQNNKYVTNDECIFNSKKYGRGVSHLMRQ